VPSFEREDCRIVYFAQYTDRLKASEAAGLLQVG
jgi:hypothetical protein